jgi:hypothetical protein
MMPFVICAGLVLSGLAALCLGCGPVQAHDLRICARPEVLRFALNHMKRSDAHIRLAANSVAEAGSPNSDAVLCAVTVEIRLYDMTRYPEHTAVIWEPRYFEVRRLDNGFAVDFAQR